MIRRGLALVAVLLTLEPVFGQERTPGSVSKPLSPRNANYSIDATLDAQRRTLTGRETLTWTNISAAPVHELQFHLYYNAWRNRDSTWMREAKLSEWWPATDERPAGDFASIDISSVKMTGGIAAADLTSTMTFIAPDDGNTDDRTVMSIPLTAAVGPGHTITLDIAWVLKIPHPFARTGVVGNYFFLGQWFPKIGVVDPSGNWNCHQFHVLTEFFADYGVYDVRMTVPRGWPLAATGVERERRDNSDGTTTYRHDQEDVHDFAWTTSPDFLERRARFEEPGLPPVDMRLMLQPEHAAQAERHFDGTRTTLRYYGEWFGAYPYGHLTIIDPAWQSETEGMEYPTLFTVGARWLNPREDIDDIEDTAVHEAGHQWWYGMVGNNEFEDAWMDEGINQYANARADAEVFSRGRQVRRFFGGFIPWVIDDVRWDRVIDGDGIASYRNQLTTDIESTAAYRWWPKSASPLAYAKPALWLHTLERALGWQMLQRMLQTFFEKWQFRHPRPGDFFQVANEVSGRDLGPFFDQVYRGSVVFDYGVENVSSVSKGAGAFVSDVVVRRYGDGIFPVEVLITFGDGSTRREAWDGGGRWTRFTIENRSRAVSAQVDPDQILLLDVNVTNNSFTTEPWRSQAASKWASKWMVWLEDQLLTWAFFV